MKITEKYIYEQGNGFEVNFTNLARIGYVGTYETLEQAIKERDRVLSENGMVVYPKGIYPISNKDGLKFRAALTIKKKTNEYKTIHLGIFDTMKEAIDFRNEVIANMH